MIISEKQFMQLLRYAEDYRAYLLAENKGHLTYINEINDFLNDVMEQQSEELRVIE